MKLVVDASVALKWFFRERAGESDAATALALLRAVAAGSVSLIQPPHFVAEVGAVLARESPQTALADLRDLLQLRMHIVAAPPVYARAVALAIAHRQHVFDTLYHALALHTPGALLVTADERYARKARSEGSLVTLARFTLPD